jgi:hypothetical protein
MLAVSMEAEKEAEKILAGSGYGRAVAAFRSPLVDRDARGGSAPTRLEGVGRKIRVSPQGI